MGVEYRCDTHWPRPSRLGSGSSTEPNGRPCVSPTTDPAPTSADIDVVACLDRITHHAFRAILLVLLAVAGPLNPNAVQLRNLRFIEGFGLSDLIKWWSAWRSSHFGGLGPARLHGGGTPPISVRSQARRTGRRALWNRANGRLVQIRRRPASRFKGISQC